MTAIDHLERLSFEELESLLAEKRRRASERRMRFIAARERALARVVALAGALNQLVLRMPRAPEGWRGSSGGDRYFRSEAFTAFRRGHDQMTSWRDRMLFVGEIVALVAFVAVLGESYRRLQSLNHEARAVQALALQTVSAAAPPVEPSQVQVLTTSGSPTIVASATPSGVTPAGVPTVTETPEANGPPTETGIALPSSPTSIAVLYTGAAETKFTVAATRSPLATLRGAQGRTNSRTPTPAPTRQLSATPRRSVTSMRQAPTLNPAGSRVPKRIVIPSIGVDAPVAEGDTPESLRAAIGHRTGSANAGERGNMVVSAHNDIYGEIFRDLHKLTAGDEVLVQAEAGQFRYVVKKVEIVLPNKIEVLEPTQQAVLTMITCYPYLLDTHRVVAIAEFSAP